MRRHTKLMTVKRPKLIWKVKLPFSDGFIIPEGITDRTVIITPWPFHTHDEIYCNLSLTSGKFLWQRNNRYIDLMQITPMNLYETIDSKEWNHSIYRVDPVTGEYLWDSNTVNNISYRYYAAHNIITYASSGENESVIVVDALDGHEIWKRSAHEITNHLQIKNSISINVLLITEDRVYVVTKGSDSHIIALDIKTGDIRKSVNIGPTQDTKMKLYQSKRHHMIYLTEWENWNTPRPLIAYDEDLNIKWSSITTIDICLTDRILICLEKDENELCYGMVGLDPATGHQIWRKSFHKHSKTEIAGQLNGTVLVHRRYKIDRLDMIDPLTGNLIWYRKVKSGYYIKAFGKWMFIGTGDIESKSRLLAYRMQP